MISRYSELEAKLSKSFSRIIGIDETNVCSYFGEVVVAGVILPKVISVKVNDSKKLSEESISRIAQTIMKTCEYFIDYVTPRECDNSLLKSEYNAIKRLCNKAKPEVVLIDFHSVPDRFHYLQYGVKGGDTICWSIAAASIVAKYIWNLKCKEYHKLYPEYNLIHNKGSFGNQLFNLTVKYGLTKHHRVEWIKSACIKKKIEFSKICRR